MRFSIFTTQAEKASKTVYNFAPRPIRAIQLRSPPLGAKVLLSAWQSWQQGLLLAHASSASHVAEVVLKLAEQDRDAKAWEAEVSRSAHAK